MLLLRVQLILLGRAVCVWRLYAAPFLLEVPDAEGCVICNLRLP